ncbi:MAG TPA: FHA domain-containing protein [Kofleriaceae bacterium]|nr:FHA domain-containing protein [Kofleriaceae bacterium]
MQLPLSPTVAPDIPCTLRRLRQFRIRVVQGRDAGREAIAEGRELTIGTAEENHLVLTDPMVSRQHLVVRCSERGYWVSDLGSTHGIVMGPHRVQVAALTHGCELSIGATRIAFELLDDEIAEPVASQERGELLGASSAMQLPAPAPGRRAHFTDDFDPALPFRDAKERAIERWERWYIGELLRHTHGNLSEAARVAHTDRGYLRKLVRKYSP